MPPGEPFPGSPAGPARPAIANARGHHSCCLRAPIGPGAGELLGLEPLLTRHGGPAQDARGKPDGDDAGDQAGDWAGDWAGDEAVAQPCRAG